MGSTAHPEAQTEVGQAGIELPKGWEKLAGLDLTSPSTPAAILAELRNLLGREPQDPDAMVRAVLANLIGLAAGRQPAHGATLESSDAVRGQVTKSAADVYEEFFVPALFAQWAAPAADAAKIAPGDRVLDVACGTGVPARHVAERVGSKGSVVGLDINDGMLDVAKRKAPSIDWRAGRAESLPFADASFDAVVSTFGLMFFEDRAKALSEMMRVVEPNGRVTVAVWDALENQPGYQKLTNLLNRLFGPEVADALRAPFVLGDLDLVRSIYREAGIQNFDIETRSGKARFPSVESWIQTEVKGWTFSEMIDDAGLARLVEAAKTELAAYVKPDGSVEFDAPAHLITAIKT